MSEIFGSDTVLDKDVLHFLLRLVVDVAFVSVVVRVYFRLYGNREYVFTYYRFLYERDKDGVLVIRHRFHAEARPRYQLGPVEVSYRIRYQEQIRGSIAEGLRHTLRNRLQVALESTRPWTPAIAAETFHRLGDGEAIRWQKLRLTAGVGYELGDHQVELFYRVEIPQSDPTDPVSHILGLGYEYAL